MSRNRKNAAASTVVESPVVESPVADVETEPVPAIVDQVAQAVADVFPAKPAGPDDEWGFEAGKTTGDAHLIVMRLMQYGVPACDQAHPFLIDSTPMPVEYGVCAYCADGTQRPANVPVVKAPRAPRATTPKVERVLTPDEQRAADYDARIMARNQFSLNACLARREELRPAWDAVSRRIAELQKIVKPATRAAGNGHTGTHAPRATYNVSVTVSTDTPELATIREFAAAGDKRAQEIIAHVDTWVDADGKAVSEAKNLPDGVCPACKSDKHIRRTGFYSSGREIVKMQERADKAGTTSPTVEPETVETPADDAVTESVVETVSGDATDDVQELPSELADAEISDDFGQAAA